MSNVVDLFFVFQFIKKLTTPFEEWDAYKYGIIDKRGRILRKRRSLRTIKERQSWTKMDVMVLKLKRILAKIPGGSTRFGTYAAALWLIKESDRIEHGGDFITEEEIREELMHYMTLAEEVTGPVNSAGSGNVAGIGVGKDGEPGLTPDQMRRYKKGNRKMFRRRRP